MVTAQSFPSSPNARMAGFTLIEILIVIVIVIIMAAIASPAITSTMAKMRIRSASSNFHMALLAARSEAVKRNDVVTIAPLNSSWNNGWRLLDAGNNVLNQENTPSGVTITSTAANIQYLRSGRVQGVVPNFNISEVPNVIPDSESRCVVINLTGLPEVNKGACP